MVHIYVTNRQTRNDFKLTTISKQTKQLYNIFFRNAHQSTNKKNK